ncbi:hypothetical protein SH528x_000131 [Novipirellula sp. SH528]|uniref:hypothetical protein n=1 Tax=Novipirellula sp. SH528 TaxID=3454466 RepID=UPI003F9F0DF8
MTTRMEECVAFVTLRSELALHLGSMMAQYQFLANTFFRSLAIATIGMNWFGVTNPAIAQSDVSSVESTPPPPVASVAPSATSEIEPTEQQTANELGYHVLLQGPVHEAFASFSDSGPITNARVYHEKPPADVREQAPDDHPQGVNMQWIPGYWSWDDQVGKHVWVSGVYRNPPPGRTWVPGYWSDLDTGYRWTSGYWAVSGGGADEQVYLHTVPTSIENGPSVLPPGEEFFWLPGFWEHAEGGYVWRSGYWTRQYEGWVWQPSCYINTPQGFVYNAGYWDRLPPDRGMLYAPIDFYRPTYLNPGFVYRPRVPLANAAALLLNLFSRRGHPGFFYGDYYGPSYAALGYRPWYDMGYRYSGFGSGFAPWFAYYDWNYGRRGIDFGGSMGRYRSFYDNGGKGAGKFDRDFDNFAGNANPSRGSQEVKAKRSFDDVVVSDFNGQSAPRVNRKQQGESARHDGGSNAARLKVERDSQGGAKRDFTPSHPKQSSPGVMADDHGGKSRGNSNSPQMFDRGPSKPSVERDSAASRSSKSFGGGSSGKGGGSGAKSGGSGKGGGNSGKGGGKK